MNTLAYILDRFGLTTHTGRLPWEINATRADLASLFAELGYTSGAEIGVERGLYTEELCKANPQATIYAIDAWEAYSGYREHVSQGKLDNFYQDTKERMASYPGCKIIRAYSKDAAAQFKPESLDWVYIDANHDFVQVVNDISVWSRRVRPGGIVAGHDYRKDKGPAAFHVPFAVQGYTQSYRVSPWFVLRGDKSASWMWVKQ